MSIENILFYFISPALIASLTSIFVTFIFNYAQSGFKEIKERISLLNSLKYSIKQDVHIVRLIYTKEYYINDSKQYLSKSLRYPWLEYKYLDKAQSEILLTYNILLTEIKLSSPDDKLLDFKCENFFKTSENILEAIEQTINTFSIILNSKVQIFPYLIYLLKSDSLIKK